jgi:Rod binding domain-containing protein
VSGLQGLQTVDPLAQGQAAQAVPGTKDKSDKAAQQFEGLLMGILFQTLRKTVVPSGLFGNAGQASSTYNYLMDQAVAERAASSGKGWGLADRLKANWAVVDKKPPEKDVSTGLMDPGKMPIGPVSR